MVEGAVDEVADVVGARQVGVDRRVPLTVDGDGDRADGEGVARGDGAYAAVVAAVSAEGVRDGGSAVDPQLGPGAEGGGEELPSKWSKWSWVISTAWAVPTASAASGVRVPGSMTRRVPSFSSVTQAWACLVSCTAGPSEEWSTRQKNCTPLLYK